MASADSPQWGTITAAAEHLEVSPRTIRRLISRGEIHARRFGSKQIRVDMATLDDAGRPLGA